MPEDGWAGLREVVVEMGMAPDQEHRPVLWCIVVVAATIGPILVPDAEIGPQERGRVPTLDVDFLMYVPRQAPIMRMLPYF